MNVSNQRLRRRLSSSTLNRPTRRVPAFKKRSRSSHDLSSAAPPSHPANTNDDGAPSSAPNARPPAGTSDPLAGVVACLSGQTEDVKDRLRAAIARLGGATVGRFDPRHVTHLILDAPAGPKYESWRANRGAAWAKTMAVVTSAWALACEREGRRVPEGGHRLSEGADGDQSEGAGVAANGAGMPMAGQKTAEEERMDLPKQIRHLSLMEKCNWMIEQQPPDKYCNLFAGQSFILAGFDDEHNAASAATADQEAPAVESSRLPATSKRGGDTVLAGPYDIREGEHNTLKGKVSKLIRRAGGTIFWEPNEWISVVLLNDKPSKRTWEDVRYFCREHPRGPTCVGVDWILKSICHRTIMDVPPFPPEPQLQPTKRKARGSGASVSSNPASITSNVTSNKRTKKGSSSVFRGDVFAVVPVKSLDGTLDFASHEMESNIAKNGGLLLSKPLLLAIKKDVASATADISTNSERRYFVVSSRWVQLDCATSYPLVGELSTLGIKAVPVSPVWVAACLENNYKYDPEEYPLLFQPQTWPIRLLESSAKGTPKFSISVTGFVDASRYGVKAMLKEIGAEFTENLTRKNTHLICKERKGQKYAKALEWGVHAVSIEWLYHVIRHGYEEGKSEDRFSMSAKAEPVTRQRDQTENGSAKPAEYPTAATSTSAPEPEVGVENGDIPNNAKECDRKAAGNVGKDQCDAEMSPSSQSSVRRRGKREPPQPSPQKRSLPQSSPKGDTGKRLQFASPLENESNNAGRPSSRRRGKRDRTPLRMSQESTSLLSQQSEEADSPEIETQFTVGTIAGDADVHSTTTSTKRQFTDDDSEAPLSQINDAQDNGESQVLWFAAPRG